VSTPSTQGGSAVPAAPRRRDAVATRRLLLEAARRRFADDGYAATTVRDVADDAGVNVALISRYFASKEGLFEACLASAADDVRRSTGGVSDVEDIPSLIARMVAGLGPDGSPGHQVLRLLLRSSGDEHAEELRIGMLRSYCERLALAAGRQPDDLRRDDVMLRAQLIFSLAVGIVLLRHDTGLEPLTSADPEQLVAPLEDVVRSVLAVR
jgi:AcrR family transcriptional regulator